MAHHALQIVPLVLGFVGSIRSLKKRQQFEKVVNRPALARAVWDLAVWLKIDDHYPMYPPDEDADIPPKFIISLHTEEEYDEEVHKKLKGIRNNFANKANLQRRRWRKEAEAAETAEAAERAAAEQNDSDSDRSSSDEEGDKDGEDGSSSSSDGDSSSSSDGEQKPAAKQRRPRASQ